MVGQRGWFERQIGGVEIRIVVLRRRVFPVWTQAPIDTQSNVDGQYAYWRDRCCVERRHGAGDGGRAAHCPDENGPYSANGICIFEGTADDPPHESPLVDT